MSLTAREQAKYERIWTFPQYRAGAPGERCVRKAIDRLGMQAGDSVVDFGCGTGRPALALKNAGMDVIAVDFAGNCMDAEPRAKVSFVNACLWNMPRTLQARWGFCTDVMEHIPPERVTDTLQSIRDATIKGAFFQIATRADRMGRLIGEPLHLTVREPGWWQDMLGRYWQSVETEASAGNLIAVCRP